jgi:hypothetical protein
VRKRNPVNADRVGTVGLERRLRFIPPPSPIPGEPSTQRCHDFSISDNFAPENCNPGIATTESGTP